MPVLTLLALLSTGDICTTQNCAVYAETATDLYQIDPVTLTQSHLCTFSGVDGPVNDIAVDDNGTLYALTADELYTVNINNCASSPLTSVSGGSGFNGLSFLLDGRLIAVDTSGDVTQINPSSGATHSLGNYGSSLGSSGDVVALSNGQIYATALDTTGQIADDILVTLDPNTFTATPVGTIQGYSHIYGLGYWAGVLYGFDDHGDVLKIDPSNASAVVAINNSFEWYGAGTTPQAPTQCTSTCSSGTTSCDNSGNLLTCTLGSNGCYDWVPSSCGSGMACSNGSCQATCSDACFPFSKQCVNGTTAETCQIQSNGCFNWNTLPCGANQVCSGGSCGSSCTNQCSPGQIQCSGNDVQGCVADSSGCYQWQTTSTCSGSEFCSSGQCSTSCNNACTQGQAACNGNIVQNCVVAGGGCTEWQNGQDCGDYGCVGSACCVCMPGDTQCAGDGNVQVCAPDPSAPNGCPIWQEQTCTSGACASGVCLQGCSPTSEVNNCPGSSDCLATQGGDFCGYSTADGGFAPAGSGTNASSGGNSSGANGGTNASGGNSGGANGTGGNGANGSGGNGAGGTNAGTGNTIVGTSGGMSGSGGSTGSTAASTATTGGNKVTASGCGCGSTSSGSAGLLALGALALLARRRTRAD